MKKNRKLTTALVAICAAALMVTAASAFVITNTLPRASAAGAAARAPGQMVNAGAGRHQARLEDFFRSPQITETAQPSFQDHFQSELAGAVDVIFAEFNQAVEFFINLLFVRAGHPPPFLPQIPDIPDPDEDEDEMESEQNGEPTEKTRLSLTQRSIRRIANTE